MLLIRQTNPQLQKDRNVKIGWTILKFSDILDFPGKLQKGPMIDLTCLNRILRIYWFCYKFVQLIQIHSAHLPRITIDARLKILQMIDEEFWRLDWIQPNVQLAARRRHFIFFIKNSRYLNLLGCTFTLAQLSVTYELFSLKFADPCKAVI